MNGRINQSINQSEHINIAPYVVNETEAPHHIPLTKIILKATNHTYAYKAEP